MKFAYAVAAVSLLLGTASAEAVGASPLERRDPTTPECQAAFAQSRAVQQGRCSAGSVLAHWDICRIEARCPDSYGAPKRTSANTELQYVRELRNCNGNLRIGC